MHAHEIHTLHVSRTTPRMKLLAAMLASGALLASPLALADGNDDCPGAPILALPLSDTGTTVGGNNTVTTLPAGCSNYTAVAGPDKIYRLEVVTAGSLTATVTPNAGSGYDAAIYLLGDAVFACPAGTGNVAPAGSCVAGADANLANLAETITVGSISPGVYHLYVDSFYSAGSGSNPNRHHGPFTLEVSGTAVLGGGTSADLSITKTDGATEVTPGGTTTYTIVASNAGPGDVSDAAIADTFPAACTSVDYTAVESGGAAGFTAAGTGNINDTGVTLPAGSSITYTAICTIDPGATGTLENTATVSSATDDPDTDNNSATDTSALVAGLPSADLSITKTDGADGVTAGGSTTYTIVASNAGPDDVADAAIVDVFPAACTDVDYTAVGAGGAAGFTAAGTGNINDTGVTLPVGSSITYTAVCTIDPDATGTLVNTAAVSSATADPDADNNSATDTSALNASADLSITKTDNATTVIAGNDTTYTIVASNAGPSGANPVTVTDNFPAACESVSYTAVGAGGASGFTAAGAGNINDAAVNLPAGASVTYTAVCTVASTATGTLENTATVSSPADPGGASSAADATAIAPAGAAPVVANVPTLGGYALGLLGLMLGLLGFAAFRRHS